MTPRYPLCAAERKKEKEAVSEPELHGAALPAPLPSEPELPPKMIPLPDEAPEPEQDPPPQVPRTTKGAACAA